jgi:RNA polymerase sigma-70 factor (ECF subfamily)
MKKFAMAITTPQLGLRDTVTDPGVRGYPGVSSGPSDADLVRLLRRRQPGAFEELFRRYRDRIWRFLARLAGRGDLAEDLFQETWLAAARNAHRLREDTQLGAWLYTIARNKHRNGLRLGASEGHKRAGAHATPPLAPVGPDERADARREAARVADAFARLPEAHREVLLLAIVEGLDGPAIASVLAIREEAVRKRLSRARAALAAATGIGAEGSDTP